MNDSKKTKRYKASVYYDGDVLSSSHGNLDELREEARRDASVKGVTDAIVIDTEKNIVQVIRGKVDPFLPGLNSKYPGWEMENVINISNS